MKTAISIPDGVFHQAERLARLLRKTRSAIYREAMAEYVVRHAPDAVTEAMNRVAAQVGGRPDKFVRAASRRVLERTEW
jgi:predicted transcriptional regulator